MPMFHSQNWPTSSNEQTGPTDKGILSSSRRDIVDIITFRRSNQWEISSCIGKTFSVLYIFVQCTKFYIRLIVQYNNMLMVSV